MKRPSRSERDCLLITLAPTWDVKPRAATLVRAVAGTTVSELFVLGLGGTAGRCRWLVDGNSHSAQSPLPSR